jgi:RNA polymerase sigma factor for flagellar operon FliA
MRDTEVEPASGAESPDQTCADVGGRSDRRGLLVEDYHDFVEALVSRLMRAMNLPFKMREDFVSAGMLGLVEAASRFDASRGSDFRSFAFLRIRGAVIDHIRASCDLTGKSYKLLKALEGAHDTRMQELVAKGQGASSGEVKAAAAIDTIAKSAVAFALVTGGDEESILSSQIPSDPEREFSRREISRKIRHLVATLPEKERTIIEQYYFHDRRLSEVARECSGLSKSWVSRLHDRALGMLRDKLVENDLKEGF